MRRTPARAGIARVVRGQALEDRVVLAVDRQQRRAAFRDRVHEQRAAHHQRFLVGEQDALAGARRGERGGQARGADDRREHRVDLGQRRDRRRALRRRPALRWRTPSSRKLAAAAAPRRDVVGTAPRSAGETCGTARAAWRRWSARRAPTTAKRSGCRATTSSVESPIEPVAPRSVDRVVIWRRNTCAASAAIGIAASSASVRSSTPPCPGSNAPLSFTPAWRFSSDSNRSPTTETDASSDDEAAIHDDQSTSGVTSEPESGVARRSGTSAQRIDRHRDPRAVDALPRLARADRGASLRLPNARPAKYAAVSAIQTIAIAASTSHGERACNSTSAIHAPTSTIQPDDRHRPARAAWATARSPTAARARSRTAPPGRRRRARVARASRARIARRRDQERERRSRRSRADEHDARTATGSRRAAPTRAPPAR